MGALTLYLAAYCRARSANTALPVIPNSVGSSSTWTSRWPPSSTPSIVTVAPLRTRRPSSNTTVRVQRDVAPTLNLTF